MFNLNKIFNYNIIILNIVLFGLTSIEKELLYQSFELMQAIRDLPSLCKFVHFPLQAGSNRILEKMHRQYTREEYFEKVAHLRSLVPDVSLGTDIIVGFPTETDAEFEETFDAMRQIRFSLAFLFAYSPRQKTPAKRWTDDVSLRRSRRLWESRFRTDCVRFRAEMPFWRAS